MRTSRSSGSRRKGHKSRWRSKESIRKGARSVDEWLEQTTIANAHVRLVYHTPEGETKEYARTYHELPPSPREIKPHPYGIEFGMLLKMLQDTKSQSVSGFLAGDFCRVSPQLADRHLQGSQGVPASQASRPQGNCCGNAVSDDSEHQDYGASDAIAFPPSAKRRFCPVSTNRSKVNSTRPSAGRRPSTAATRSSSKQDWLSAIGRVNRRSRSSPPGHERKGRKRDDDAELARVIRYANRVPLLYQQSACATFKAALNTTWKNYGVPQSRGALPAGPMVIFVHMASVWVPFTSESKEAIADYDEIQKEITLALRECGRRLGLFLRRRERAASEYRRRNIFELYIEEVVEACNRLKGGSCQREGQNAAPEDRELTHRRQQNR